MKSLHSSILSLAMITSLASGSALANHPPMDYSHLLGNPDVLQHTTRFLTNAAKHGSASAQYQLGLIYSAQQKMDSAFYWMIKAKQSGFPAAPVELAKWWQSDSVDGC